MIKIFDTTQRISGYFLPFIGGWTSTMFFHGRNMLGVIYIPSHIPANTPAKCVLELQELFLSMSMNNLGKIPSKITFYAKD